MGANDNTMAVMTWVIVIEPIAGALTDRSGPAYLQVILGSPYRALFIPVKFKFRNKS